MRQTLALFLDSYRDLNSRKLFWVALVISAAVVVALSFVGIHDGTLTFLHWHWEMYEADFFYRAVILSGVIFGVWLSWGAVILALVSTAGIFPDLISSGAIDLYLSKPIGRLRLFLTKYFTGLLFVLMQLTLCCAGVFVVAGWRAHLWRPSIFLAIPLILLMFSYVYAICVLLGVWTRSTMAALLLGALLWLAFSGVERLEPSLLLMQRGIERSIASDQRDIHYLQTPGHDTGFMGLRAALDKNAIKADQDNLTQLEKAQPVFHTLHSIANGVRMVIPKTTETNNLLDRWLMTTEELEAQRESARSAAPGPVPFGMNRRDFIAANVEVLDTVRSRSPLSIIGSSLIAEAVLIALAAWIFCRRDY